ncbi:MAG: chorismate synthase, partial [Clostridiales Family XIII bacterium]|nr:chorismate synthase [Clostridiales Family XIII bacterium]
MDTWGRKIRITIFGESHGPEVGVVIDGLPEGTPIDRALIARDLARRAPGRDEFSTARKESDEPILLSGVSEGVSTAEPIHCVIKNENQRSGDYDTALRPGHADWTGLIKYGPGVSRAGGGRFSGRLTAPLVFAGAVAKSALAEKGIEVFGRIKSIGAIRDEIDLSCGRGCRTGGRDGIDELKAISSKAFPADDSVEQRFKDAILAAKADGDSVGGVIEVISSGNLAGLGEPFFDSVESVLSSLYFSVPAVKGVEFGAGFGITKLRGSEANDPIRIEGGEPYTEADDTIGIKGGKSVTDADYSISIEGGRLVTETNNNGGVLGGIANGMPIIARVAIKPTASIAKEQRTVDPGKYPPGVTARGGENPGDEAQGAMKETTIR